MTESTPRQRKYLGKGICHNPSVSSADSSLYTREPWCLDFDCTMDEERATDGRPYNAHSKQTVKTGAFPSNLCTISMRRFHPDFAH